MIITAIPRSGSTKFARDYAAANNLTFYDEVLEYLAPMNHKVESHESQLPEVHRKDAEFLYGLDFTSCVINNHDMNYFTLLKTDMFVSRKNIQDSVWSYIAYSDLLINHAFGHSNDELLVSNLERLFKKITMFLQFTTLLKRPITIPQDIVYRDSTPTREKYSWLKGKVEGWQYTITLPPGLIYE